MRPAGRAAGNESLPRCAIVGVRDACVEVFSLRGTHAWPPKVQVYPLWPDQYSALTKGMGFPVTDVADAAAAVEAMIVRISKASSET